MGGVDAARRFAISAYTFLIDKRGFPSPALGIGQYGDEHHQPTVVVIDPTTERVLCIIEQLADEDSSLRIERGKKCLEFRNRQALRDVPAYLLMPGEDDPDKLRVFMLDARGEWQAINAKGFPTYVELTSLQSPLKQVEYQQDKAAGKTSRASVSMIVILAIIFTLSVLEVIKITQNDLWLLAGIGFFVVFPEITKIKILHVEAERVVKGKE
jgi:hypothetical protein